MATVEQNAVLKEALIKFAFVARRDVDNIARLASADNFGQAERSRAMTHVDAIRSGAEDLAVSLGANKSVGYKPNEAIPLELLNTYANRRLLSALQDAAAFARAVDVERGIDPEESLTGILMSLAETVRVECHGPKVE